MWPASREYQPAAIDTSPGVPQPALRHALGWIALAVGAAAGLWFSLPMVYSPQGLRHK
jgi:hypothetical protein